LAILVELALRLTLGFLASLVALLEDTGPVLDARDF